MKRTSVLLLLVVTLLSGTAFAKIKPLETKVGNSASFTIIPKAKLQKFDLVYVSDKASPVTVSIYNEEGERIHIQKIKGYASFMKSFDVSDLTDGEYIVEVENEEGKAKELLRHSNSVESFNVLLSKSTDDKINVLVAGYDYDQPVELKIYDGDDRLIHTENINVGKDFMKTFNMSELNTEDVTFLVSNNKNFVYKSSEL